MLMDWVHCNNCFQLPGPDRRFFLTSCGHLFCNSCEESCTREVCKLCKNKCNTLPLSSNMKPDVQIYFSDPHELFVKKLKEVQKIASFQKNHRARLMTYYRKELNKSTQMKDEFKKILKNLKEIESKRKQISDENKALKRIIEMSGLGNYLQSPTNVHASGGSRKEGGSFLPHDRTPGSAHSNRSVTDMLNNGASGSSGRLSVFSPPMNCKMGRIPGTPSPSAALRNLRLNAASLSDLRQNNNEVPDSQDSQESGFNLRPNFLTPSPNSNESWDPRNMSSMAFQNRRDPRRVVVHPYSPNDL